MGILYDAYTAAQRAIESTYRGTLTVFEQVSVTDPDTHLTRQQETPALSDVPCKLSYSSIAKNTETETVAVKVQSMKVFIPPTVTIKPGSKLVIQQDGVSHTYCASGEPAIYPTHKEIALELFEGYA